MAVQTILAATALLLWMARSALGAGCVDSSTVMFGAPWQPSFTVEEQESHYRERGQLTQLWVYFNIATGCVVGVKGTYGLASSMTSTLGVDFDNAADSSTLVAQQMQLPKGQFITGVQYKVGSCIEFVQFTTNSDHTLQIGNYGSPNSLQSSMPAPGSYLGFFKATVDSAATVSEESDAAHPLQQLQMIWVKTECSQTAPGEERVIPPSAGVDTVAAANRLRIVGPQQKPTAGPSNKSPGNAPAGAAGAQGKQQQQNLRLAQTAAAAGAATASGYTSSDRSAEAPVLTEVPEEQIASTATDTNANSNGKTPTQTVVASSSTADLAASAKQKASGTVAGAPCVPKGCHDGLCDTSSCALHGMGRDVPAMLCFGTNIVPKLLKVQEAISPCSNLACKLTKSNCTSTGLLGIGGFCTGRVVAMGATAELHDTGKVLIGYPCIEHRGFLTEAVTRSGDYSAKGTYVSKAWKVCDCAPALRAVDGSNLVTLGDLGHIEVTHKDGNNDVTHLRLSTPTFHLGMPDVKALLAKQNLSLPQLPTFGADKLHKPLTNMSVADVVTQWMAAFADLSTVHSSNVTDAKINALKALIPGFKAPSIIVPNISAPLLKVPVSFDLPTFTIPEKMFSSVALLLPHISQTSLPSLILPDKLPGSNLPGVIHIRNISTPNFYGMMEKFILKLPDCHFNVTLPHLPSLKPAFDVPDVLKQWISGIVSNSPLPRIQVAVDTLTKLRSLLPKLPKLPTLVTLEAAIPWFSKEHTRNISMFIIPNSVLPQVHKLIPNLTNLPTFLEPTEPRVITINLPALTVPNVTLPSFKQQLGKILSHMHPIPTLKAYQKDAEDHVIDFSYSLKDQMTDAADSLSSAVRQALGKLPAGGVKVKFAGPGAEKLAALSTDEAHKESALIQYSPNPSRPPQAFPNPSAPPTTLPNPSAPPTVMPNPSKPPVALANPSKPPQAFPNPSAQPSTFPNPSAPPTVMLNPSKPPEVLLTPSKPPAAFSTPPAQPSPLLAPLAPPPAVPSPPKSPEVAPNRPQPPTAAAAQQPKPSTPAAKSKPAKAAAAAETDPVVMEAPGLVMPGTARNGTGTAELLGTEEISGSRAGV